MQTKKKSSLRLKLIGFIFFNLLLSKPLFEINQKKITEKDLSLVNNNLRLDFNNKENINTDNANDENKMVNIKIEAEKISKLNNNSATTIIIGSGPAGIASALYSARNGERPLVIAGTNYGGQLTGTGDVENVPFVMAKKGKDLISDGITQAQKFGAIFLYENCTQIITSEYPYKIVTTNGIYYAFSIILAMGSEVKKLNCPGIEKYWGKGVSSCAICDAPLYKEKVVAVVGGGDSACEEALQLSHHAKKIHLLVRSNKMRASQIMQERVMNDKKIEINYETEVKEIIGDENKIIKIIATKDKKEINLEISGLFIAIGHTPNTSLIKDIVQLTKEGLVECIGRSQTTSVPGVFAAGEIEDGKYRQAGVCAGNGIKASLDASEFLIKQEINSSFITSHEKIWKKNDKTCVNGVCSVNVNSLNESTQNKKKKIIDIKSKTAYENIINENKKKYYLIELYATFCPACTVMKKALEEYITSNNALETYMINIENIPEIADKFNISSIPVLILMDGKKEIARAIGSMDTKKIENWLKKHIKK